MSKYASCALNLASQIRWKKRLFFLFSLIHLMNHAKEMTKMVEKMKAEITELVANTDDVDLLDLVLQMLKQEQE